MPLRTGAEPFRILDLPAELVSAVCDHLYGHDVLNVRQVCRTLYTYSTAAFGTHYFRDLVTILHPTSLAHLLEIAKHPTLSRFVTKVLVSGQRVGTELPESMNTGMHVDAQISIEKSGLDSMILGEALHSFKNLNTVMVAVAGYNRGITGLKCGLSQIFKQSKSESFVSAIDDIGYNRVYELVLPIIETIDLAGKIALVLQFCATAESPASVYYFNVGSECWKESVSKRMVTLRIGGKVDPQWTNALIDTLGHCQQLELVSPYYSGAHSAGMVSSNLGRALQWEKLTTLKLVCYILDYNQFTQVLRVHQLNLMELDLRTVGLSEGTWGAHLAIIQSMPKLVRLTLRELLERHPAPIHVPKKQFSSGPILKALGNKNIQFTIKIMLTHLSTRLHKGRPVSTVDFKSYPFELDLRNAIAFTEKRDFFLKGFRYRLRFGEWVPTQVWPRLL